MIGNNKMKERKRKETKKNETMSLYTQDQLILSAA